ncbi:MAG: TonB-dependent receptor [Leptolyngbyaceae cyanobacterium SM1_4_3]|nr:TonB-dependent receptor [Leptolyngbyaceae cyanobacterium SM1_4_3]
MINQLRYLTFGIAVLSVLVATSVRAEIDSTDVEELSNRENSPPPPYLPTFPPPLSNLEQPATTVEEWIAQIEQSVVQVTRVQVNATETGLEIILETNEPLEVPSTSAVGNALITDIPNAVLTLPEGGEFQAANPTAEIALVSVAGLPNNRVRVAITGVDALPSANLSVEASGLVIAVTPGTGVAEIEDDAIQVVVTATRTEEDILDVPRSVTVITREEIEEQSRLNRNLFEILGTTVPGFGPPNQSDRNNAQTLRGRDVLILIDGVPQSSNFFGAAGFASFDSSTVERIEVVSGPTGLYGSGAAGGVINVITSRPEEPFTVQAEVGISADLGELEGDSFAYDLGFGFSGIEGNIDYLFNFAGRFTNQFYDAEGDRIPQNNPTLSGATVLNFFGRSGIDITDEQRLQISASHVRDRREVDFITDPIVQDISGRQRARALAADLSFDELERPGNTTTNINLNYTHDDVFGSRLQAQAYYWDNDVTDFPFDDRGGFIDAIVYGPFLGEAFGGRLQIETPIAQPLELLWGVDYRNERNENIFFVIDPVAFDEDEVVRSLEERTWLPPYFVDQLGLFGQLQWDVTPDLAFSGGIRQEFVELRADDYTTFFGDDIEGGTVNFDATVFNAGLVYRATDNISLFASFSQGFSVPGFFTFINPPAGFSIEGGFEELEAQKVDNYEIGVRGRWDNLQASLAGYYAYSEQGAFLQNIPGTALSTLIRAPQRNYGVEAAIDWQPGDQWQLGTTFGWNEGEADADDDGEFLALGTFDVQPWKLTAYVQHQTTPTWNNRLQLLYSGNRDRGFEDGSDGVAIEEYITFDLISQFQLGDGTLSLAVENLLDNQYFPVFSQVASGFNDAGYLAARGRRVSLTYSISW